MGLQLLRSRAQLYQRLFGKIQSRTLMPCVSLNNDAFTMNKDFYQTQLSSYKNIHRNLCTSRPCTEKTLPQKLRTELESAFKTIDFNQLKSAPLPTIVYGFGGIVPFVAPPLYFICASYSPLLASAQLLYGATILAFVGGVKWGNALAKNTITNGQIGISTVPSLVAWSALMVPEPVGFIVVSTGLVGALYVDLLSSGYPPWFIAMRATLTGIAVTSLMTTFICVLNH